MEPSHGTLSWKSSNQKSSNDIQDTRAQRKPRSTIAGRSNVTKRTTKTAARSPASVAMTPGLPGPDRLSSLSPEILDMITNEITQKSSISALSQTSKRFYTLMAPRLYHHIAVGAFFHAHIANLIRTLEPLLTLGQKKLLRTEGKYKGQRDKYPSGLDDEKLSICAGYVRQLTFGHSNPGKKHMYIVYRYFEEALENLTNLEIVDTMVVNKSICESIASLANLQALGIYAMGLDSDEVAPLAGTKNLKHLNLNVACQLLPVAQSIIRNSLFTLQSLRLVSNTSSGAHCFQDWENNLKQSDYDTAISVEERSRFSALRSLHLEAMPIDEEFVEVFAKAFEFSKLRELGLKWLTDPRNLFYPFLTELVTSCRASDIPLGLRTLFVDMDNREPFCDHGTQHLHFAAQCALIASFDTLATLKICGFGEYDPRRAPSGANFPDALLQAILKHKNLQRLSINYTGIGVSLTIPWLRGNAIGDIVDGLPHLRELEFAADDSYTDDISQSLSRGRNLEIVNWCYYKGWNQHPTTDPDGWIMLFSTLSAFMTNAKLNHTDSTQEFVWEEHCNLRRIYSVHNRFEVASKFGGGKTKKGETKPKKFQVNLRDGTVRSVWYRRIPMRPFRQLGYDDTFRWVKRVEKELASPPGRSSLSRDITTIDYGYLE